LKIKVKNESEVGQKWSQNSQNMWFCTINAFHAVGMRKKFLDAWPTLISIQDIIIVKSISCESDSDLMLASIFTCC